MSRLSYNTVGIFVIEDLTTKTYINEIIDKMGLFVCLQDFNTCIVLPVLIWDIVGCNLREKNPRDIKHKRLPQNNIVYYVSLSKTDGGRDSSHSLKQLSPFTVRLRL